MLTTSQQVQVLHCGMTSAIQFTIIMWELAILNSKTNKTSRIEHTDNWLLCSHQVQNALMQLVFSSVLGSLLSGQTAYL
jgi:uncharacterized membrane protein